MNATQTTLKAQLQFSLGDRLAKALQVANVSNNDMAAYLGKSRTSISNWIHERAPIGRGDLVAWALKTGVPLEWLETGHFPDTPETEKGNAPASTNHDHLIHRLEIRDNIVSLDDFRELRARA